MTPPSRRVYYVPAVEGRDRPASHQMIKSFKLEHFRCFERLELTDLRRINVLVGRNASGKTALLEGIRIGLGGTPGAAWTLNQLRGLLTYLPLPATREQFEAQWNYYFHGLDIEHPISARWQDSEGREASLIISYDPAKSVTPTRQVIGGAPPPVTTIIPLKFARTNLNGQASDLYATIDPNGQLQLQPGPEIGPVTEFFTSSWGNVRCAVGIE